MKPLTSSRAHPNHLQKLSYCPLILQTLTSPYLHELIFPLHHLLIRHIFCISDTWIIRRDFHRKLPYMSNNWYTFVPRRRILLSLQSYAYPASNQACEHPSLLGGATDRSFPFQMLERHQNSPRRSVRLIGPVAFVPWSNHFLDAILLNFIQIKSRHFLCFH